MNDARNGVRLAQLHSHNYLSIINVQLYKPDPVSHKDKKYFIDGSIYNCPFCKRGNVSYIIIDQGSFDNSNTKTAHFYIIQCTDCGKESFHLSEYKLDTRSYGHTAKKFTFPPKQVKVNLLSERPSSTIKDIFDRDGNHVQELDDAFYHSQPTAYFTIDERIPASIRKPLNECDGSLKNNFLTGASAGLRKAIYKLLKHEDIPERNHDDRIDLLKEKYPKLEPELLDELKAVHTLTSQELHENDWKDFDSHTLKHLLEVTREILLEIYVIPDETKKRREKLSELKKKAKPKKT